MPELPPEIKGSNPASFPFFVKKKNSFVQNHKTVSAPEVESKSLLMDTMEDYVDKSQETKKGKKNNNKKQNCISISYEDLK